LHGVYAEQVGLLHGGLLGAAASLAERVSVRWADVSTTVSRQVAQVYRRLGLEVVYVPNAVDVAGGGLEGVRVGEVQAVYVGRLSREKNVEAVVELARRIPGAAFVVVGDGPEAGKLRKAAKEVRNIFFTGGVSRRTALQYIKGSDVLVLPSLMEGLSTVVLEAMALKTPVVASKVGGNMELIQDGRTGLLVNPRDLENLTEAVSTLLNDRSQARRIAENAYRHFLENYSWDVVLPKYLKVYGLE
ncbi:MAG: glycosyltransferase family 4 protein, partial [Candidatus Caldarchaeum sp.]